MLFRIETHLHTKTSSGCGLLSSREILEGYKNAGYDGLCVTDNYLRYYFDKMDIMELSPRQRLQRFLKGYYELLDEAEKYNIRIYKGAEVRFDENDNDYLLYGWPDELLLDADAIFSMGIERFSILCRQCGALLIQAHPYRAACLPAKEEYIDGVEVFNASPRHQHDNRNHLAMEFAKKHERLIRFSGSDCHRSEDIARSGIIVDKLPQNESDLASMIRSGNFSCIMPIM